MARTYAGILGYLALAVTLLRGALHGAGLEGSLWQGLTAMAVMAVVGAFVGGVAQWTVDEAVRVSLDRQLAGTETDNAKSSP